MVSIRASKAVLCLSSALAFHQLADFVPDQIHLALKKSTEPPRIPQPPVRVYSPEKTLMDCFKFRHKIGPEIAVQALRRYAQRDRINLPELIRLSRLCRVTKIIKPYLEAIF